MSDGAAQGDAQDHYGRAPAAHELGRCTNCGRVRMLDERTALCAVCGHWDHDA